MKVIKCSACGKDHEVPQEDIKKGQDKLNYFICKNTNIEVKIKEVSNVARCRV